jgi:hypothetical protein
MKLAYINPTESRQVVADGCLRVSVASGHTAITRMKLVQACRSIKHHGDG